jgi:hypothetical protein
VSNEAIVAEAHKTIVFTGTARAAAYYVDDILEFEGTRALREVLDKIGDTPGPLYLTITAEVVE